MLLLCNDNPAIAAFFSLHWCKISFNFSPWDWIIYSENSYSFFRLEDTGGCFKFRSEWATRILSEKYSCVLSSCNWGRISDFKFRIANLWFICLSIIEHYGRTIRPIVRVWFNQFSDVWLTIVLTVFVFPLTVLNVYGLKTCYRKEITANVAR